ncbi:MAG: restriction endonuclease [Gammaproteobacteria bacterium]|nr:restriction endonuclease [Gammaproteobacteria bacterium]
MERIPDPRVRERLERHIDDYGYDLSCDVQCYVDDRFALAIECKAYTEVAMLKRIMVDATLLRGEFPSLRFVLFQLESQLGGDYSQLANPPTGSPSAHTVMSRFEVIVEVITLLGGERRVDQPIHREEFFKELTAASLAVAVVRMGNLLPKP